MEEVNKQYGGASPKATKKKKKDSDKIQFEMTTKAAQNLREASETAINGNTQTRIHTLEKIFLGKFPIMVQSDFVLYMVCHETQRYNLGECKNDLGGYFIIDGKEKTIVSQEKFADNMLYIKKWTMKNIYILQNYDLFQKTHRNQFVHFQ